MIMLLTLTTITPVSCSEFIPFEQRTVVCKEATYITPVYYIPGDGYYFVFPWEIGFWFGYAGYIPATISGHKCTPVCDGCYKAEL